MRVPSRARVVPPILLLLVLAGCAGPAAVPDGSAVAPDQRLDFRPARELTVGFVIVDGVFNTELTAPLDILHHSTFHADPGMRVFTVAPSPEPVTSFEGLRLIPDYHFGNAPEIDVLVVPSGEHSMDSDLEDADLIGFVHERGRRARFVMSLCDGAFVLARAGLLEGREATTFPSDVPRLREMFPGVVVHEGVSFVHDGKAITSVGGAKSFDPALYLAELLYGERAARGMAGGLVIDWDLDQVEHVYVPHPASR